MKTHIFLAGLVALFIGCATTPNIPEIETPEAQLYLAKCTQCHSWVHPNRHNVVEWNHYLALMVTHMKKKNLPFSPQDKATITNYLHRNAR